MPSKSFTYFKIISVIIKGQVIIMTEKEIAEIRRRFNIQKTNISKICGCYVGNTKQIISEFSHSFISLSETEAEEILSILKKTLSGSVGRNLLDIDFSPSQVENGEEQKILADLRNSRLEDRDALLKLYSEIISAVEFDSTYIIMLAYENYDVFSYKSDGTKEEESEKCFPYFVCAVCPIKLSRPELSYLSNDNSFKSTGASAVVSAPEIGFMYPAFDGRDTNIYSALFYTRNISDSRERITDSLFKCKAAMPAKLQKQTLDSVISRAIGEECSYDVVQSIHAQISEMAAEHKAKRIPEPLLIGKETLKRLLDNNGVAREKQEKFDTEYDSEFGKGCELPPKNIVDSKKIELKTEKVNIKVSSEDPTVVKTKIIDGTKYILIRADCEVEVNGVKINIK